MTIDRLSPRFSLALVALALVAGSACDRTVNVTWTLEGMPAADACSDEIGNDIVVSARTNRGADEAPLINTVEAACSAGGAVVMAGQDAQVTVELLRGDAVVGLGGPVEVPKDQAEPSVDVDIRLELAILHANLLVVDDTCGEAGASSFDVKLFKELNARDVMEIEDAAGQVSCDDGNARFTYDGLEIGSRYFVYAETTAGGVEYATPPPGVGLDVERAQHTLDVALLSTERPPTDDAGPNVFVDGGPTDSGPDETDSGPGETDSGPGETDAGFDAGPDETDAGFDSGPGETDAGYDAGPTDMDAGAGADAGDAG